MSTQSGGETSGLLTYRDVADRIETALGERPALSALRAAAATTRRSRARTRVTAGMPAPLSTTPGTPTLFDPAAIDAWLADHPRRQTARLLAHLAAAPAEERAAAVRRARDQGLSWQQIASALNQVDGTRHSRQWAQQRFGDQTTGSGSPTIPDPGTL